MGLVKYDFGVCLLKKEAIDKFIITLLIAPLQLTIKTILQKTIL